VRLPNKVPPLSSFLPRRQEVKEICAPRFPSSNNSTFPAPAQVPIGRRAGLLFFFFLLHSAWQVKEPPVTHVFPFPFSVSDSPPTVKVPEKYCCSQNPFFSKKKSRPLLPFPRCSCSRSGPEKIYRTLPSSSSLGDSRARGSSYLTRRPPGCVAAWGASPPRDEIHGELVLSLS